MLQKDLGICIRTTDYSDTSQVLVFFTKDNGKISVLAKGTKRPKSSFGGPVELFTFANLVFRPSEQGLGTLTELDTQKTFPALAAKLYALNCALFASELIDKFFQEYDAHPVLFEKFLKLLDNLNAADLPIEQLRTLILLQLTLLKEIGVLPVFSHCTNCKQIYSPKIPWYFSSSANGLICRNCEANFIDKMSLSEKTASALANMKQITTADHPTLKQIEKTLIFHFTELLHKPPKMAKYILP